MCQIIDFVKLLWGLSGLTVFRFLDKIFTKVPALKKVRFCSLLWTILGFSICLAKLQKLSACGARLRRIRQSAIFDARLILSLFPELLNVVQKPAFL